MADDFDPYPSGYMNSGTLSPDDPLLDWGSNMKPTDLYRYTHDPEGFKQQMIDQGIPPPSHNYTPTDRGLQAVDNSGQPVRRGQLPGQITGEAFGFQGEGRGPTGALPFSSEPPPRPEDKITGKYAYKPQPQPAPAPPTTDMIVNDPSKGNLTGPVGIGKPQGPLGSIVEKLPQTDEEARRRIKAPFEKFGKPSVGPKPAEAAPAPTPAPKLPEPITVKPLPPVVPQVDSLDPTQKAAAIAKKTGEEVARKELDNFAKSLQGIKAPTPPPLNAVGTPSVRSPAGIHPSVQNLLAMAGQQHPAAVASLMRLLGRA